MQTVYNVVNRFVVDDRATRAVNRMAGSFMGLNKQIFQTRSALGTLLTTGGTIGTFMLLVKLKQGLMDYNREMEKSKIAIGAIFNAARSYKDPISNSFLQGWPKFNAALSESHKLMKQFQIDAALSVGTTSDFVDIAQSIADPIMRMGKGPEELRKFTKATITAASVLRVDFPQAARDMMSSLTGTAGIDVKLYRLLGSPGGGAKSFNALPAEKRFEILLNSLERYAIAAKAFENSWSGVTSTISDMASIFLGRAGQPFFETLKSNLIEVKDLLFQNIDAITQFADVFGKNLGKGLQMVTNLFKFLVEHRNQVMMIVSSLLGIKILHGLSGMSFTGFGRRVWRRGAVAIGRTSQFLSPQGPMGQYPMQSLGLGGTLIGSYALRYTKQFFGFFTSGATASIIKVVTALWRFIKYTSIAGAVVLLIGATIEAFRKNVNNASSHFGKSFNRLIGSVMRLCGSPAAPLWKLFSILWKLAELVGSAVIHAIAGLADALNLLLTAAEKTGYGIYEIFRKKTPEEKKEIMDQNNRYGPFAVWFGIKRFIDGYKKASAPATGGTDFINKWSSGWKGFSFGPEPEIPGTSDLHTPTNVTNIHGGVHIRQEFKENMEPDRIAFATFELLNRLANNPTQPKRLIVGH